MYIFSKKLGFSVMEIIFAAAIVLGIGLYAYNNMYAYNARNTSREMTLKSIQDLIKSYEVKGSKLEVPDKNIITSNLGKIYGLRRSHIVTLNKSIFPSSKLDNLMFKDPLVESNYILAYLNNDAYQIFSIKELKQGGIESYVVGPFKSDAVISKTKADIGSDEYDYEIEVFNSKYFVIGDVISINDEDMVIEDIDISSDIITVSRDALKRKFHTSGSEVKITNMNEDAQSLLCLGAVTSYKDSMVCTKNKIVDSVPVRGSIINGGKITPYALK